MIIPDFPSLFLLEKRISAADFSWAVKVSFLFSNTLTTYSAIATNNATERLIGLDYKIHPKTARGIKSMAKILNNCYL